MSEPTTSRKDVSSEEPVNEMRAALYKRLMEAEQRIAQTLYEQGVSHEAVLAALEFPSLLKDLFEGFLAVRKGDPGVAVPARAPEPDGKVPKHVSSPRILMIPVCRRPGSWPRSGFFRIVTARGEQAG